MEFPRGGAGGGGVLQGLLVTSQSHASPLTLWHQPPCSGSRPVPLAQHRVAPPPCFWHPTPPPHKKKYGTGRRMMGQIQPLSQEALCFWTRMSTDTQAHPAPCLPHQPCSLTQELRASSQGRALWRQAGRQQQLGSGTQV